MIYVFHAPPKMIQLLSDALPLNQGQGKRPWTEQLGFDAIPNCASQNENKLIFC